MAHIKEYLAHCKWCESTVSAHLWLWPVELRPTNERRRYNVTSSLIGWVQTQKDPWEWLVKIAEGVTGAMPLFISSIVIFLMWSQVMYKGLGKIGHHWLRWFSSIKYICKFNAIFIHKCVSLFSTIIKNIMVLSGHHVYCVNFIFVTHRYVEC